MKKILVIDDDMDMCQLLARFLQRKGFETAIASNGAKGIAAYKEGNYDLVLCDFRLGDKECAEVLREIKKINHDALLIFITGYSDIKTAVEMMRQGAYDYIAKPLIPDEVLNLINKALNESPAERNAYPSKSNQPSENTSSQYMIGKSPGIQEMYRQIETIAPTSYSVIIYGESGTGKEVVAKTIHTHSDLVIKKDCLKQQMAALYF
jgi:two-component system, NtrC family, response regulator HydG